jgi:hypothetical protein
MCLFRLTKEPVWGYLKKRPKVDFILTPPGWISAGRTRQDSNKRFLAYEILRKIKEEIFFGLPRMITFCFVKFIAQ